MRLAISWVAFICDSCDPTDRRTFRWTVNALRTAYEVTGGKNILHLDPREFALLRKSVAALVSFLILHFDILGAKSSMEAKREAERAEAMRRRQRLQENFTDDFLPRDASSASRGQVLAERSIRLVREERLRLIAALEESRVGFNDDQHLIGQVLDEQVSEDRSLVFLAASASNIALRWQQGAFIGGGANGNVYIGFNLDSGGIMAVKEIRVQDLANSPQLYKQIKDESDVMSMLSHDNIVEYYGIEVSLSCYFGLRADGRYIETEFTSLRNTAKEVVWPIYSNMAEWRRRTWSRSMLFRCCKVSNIYMERVSSIVMSSRIVSHLTIPAKTRDKRELTFRYLTRRQLSD
jgi:mitogen-activated protein kinase kinase kinase